MDKLEEQFYEIATQEVASNDIRPGVMAKAIVEAKGDKKAAVLKYISLRVEQLLDEHKQSISERRKREEDEWVHQFSASFTHWVRFLGKRIIGGFVFFMILGLILPMLRDFVSEDVFDMFGTGIIATMIMGFPVYLIASIVSEKKRKALI